MIKICGCAFRKPGIDAAAWLDHYHERHGPLIASLHGYNAHLLAYRQNYVDPAFTHLPGGVTETPGGVSELWFEDIDAADRAFSDPEYLEVGVADETSFVDLANGISLFGQEHMLVGNTSSASRSWTSEPRFRLFVFRKAVAGSSRKDFRQSWLAAGHDMARQTWFAPVARYVQTHTLTGTERVRRPPRHDVVDEFQFNSPEAAFAFASTTPAIAGGAALALTDPKETLALLGRSHLVIGR